MRGQFLGILVLALLLCGCGQNLGVRNVNQNEDRPRITVLGFALTTPAGLTVEPGKKKTFEVVLRRGKDFDKEVKLTVGKTPKGVTVTPKEVTVEARKSRAEFTLEAGKDAALAKGNLEITADPKPRDEQTALIVIEVAKAKPKEGGGEPKKEKKAKKES